MAPAWRNFKNIFFTICTWPNRPVGAKILSGFQLEGKTDVWISQVRRVKLQALKLILFHFLTRLPKISTQMLKHKIHPQMYFIQTLLLQIKPSLPFHSMMKIEMIQVFWICFQATKKTIKAMHNVSFDWFLSGLERILNLEFC